MIELLLSVALSQVPVDTSCPAGTHFVEGRGCVAKIAPPACPAGTRFDGAKCAALVDTSCPAGMSFVAGTGCVQGKARPAAAPKGGQLTPPPLPDPEPTPAAGGYARDEVLGLLASLGAKHDMSRQKLQDLSKALTRFMEGADFQRLTSTRPVRGVLVYQGAEAGLVVKFMSAEGLVSLKGGHQAAKVSLRSVSAGAQIGGSAMWGVALLLGLAREADLGGDYTGAITGATAADETAQHPLVLTQEGKPQVLWLVNAGRGLSAGAGGVKLTVTPDW